MIRIVFFGTPHFAAEIFRSLHAQKVPIVGVVTQPDRPKGRSLQMSFSPVKEAVLELAPEIPLFQPLKASDPTSIEQLSALGADLFVVVAFGQILSQKLLDVPPLGCINVHASLLPKYRGAAPIQRCLMAGEKETGIAIQKMVKQLDAGDVIATKKVLIPEEMTAGELEKELCEAAKPLLLEVIRKFERAAREGYLSGCGKVLAAPQDHALATYASKIELEEGEIHWNRPAVEIHNLIRAFSPRPGAWCWVQMGSEKKRLKILRARIASPNSASRATIPCAQGAIELLEVQPEGKKVLLASDWLRGAPHARF